MMRSIVGLSDFLIKIRLILFALFLVLEGCIQRPGCLEQEDFIFKQSLAEYKLEALFPFEWDSLYVIPGPRFRDDVSHIIHTYYGEEIEDDTRRYIFISGNRIVEDLLTTCEDVDFFDMMQTKGFASYGRNDVIKVNCTDQTGQRVCYVLQ